MVEEDSNNRASCERRWGMMWRPDAPNPIAWSLILIWAGFVFLAEPLGWVADVTWWHPWAMVFLGAGAILMLSGLVRFIVNKARDGSGGNIFLGFVFGCIGAGMLGGWSLIWPLALIAIGLGWLLSYFLKR